MVGRGVCPKATEYAAATKAVTDAARRKVIFFPLDGRECPASASQVRRETECGQCNPPQTSLQSTSRRKLLKRQRLQADLIWGKFEPLRSHEHSIHHRPSATAGFW